MRGCTESACVTLKFLSAEPADPILYSFTLSLQDVLHLPVWQRSCLYLGLESLMCEGCGTGNRNGCARSAELTGCKTILLKALPCTSAASASQSCEVVRFEWI